MPETDAPTLSTVSAARLAGVAPRTFRRWLKRNPLSAQVVYGPNGPEHRYTFAGVDALVRKMRGHGLTVGAQVDEPTSSVVAAHGSTDTDGPPDTAPGQAVTGGQLALPVVGEFLDLLADLRDQLARGNAREERADKLDARMEILGHQVERLAEVLAARLPGPPAPPSPPPRVRWRAVAEVSLLGVVVLLAGAMVAAVARVLQINGAIVLPW